MSAIQIKTQSDLDRAVQQIDSWGTELNASQDSFKIAVKATIQQAANIGRIASDAQAYIDKLPTKHQMARILHCHVGTILYKKRTFSFWIDEYTDMGRTTIYDMIELYEALRNEPDYEPPKGMSWRDCLAFLTGKEKRRNQIEQEKKEAVEQALEEAIDVDVLESNVILTEENKGLREEMKKINNYKVTNVTNVSKPANEKVSSEIEELKKQLKNSEFNRTELQLTIENIQSEVNLAKQKARDEELIKFKNELPLLKEQKIKEWQEDWHLREKKELFEQMRLKFEETNTATINRKIREIQEEYETRRKKSETELRRQTAKAQEATSYQIQVEKLTQKIEKIKKDGNLIPMQYQAKIFEYIESMGIEWEEFIDQLK